MNNIQIKNNGYVTCKSNFYTACDLLTEKTHSFKSGINYLVGEIDAGVWAVSYLLSMYRHRPSDFVLFSPATVTVDGAVMPLRDFAEHACYLDTVYPLFDTEKSIRQLILESGSDADGVCDLFQLDQQRRLRALSKVGNERFRAMAAIGYAYGKQVFCFPWLSRMRFDYYQRNITWLLDFLSLQKRTVILPIGT